MDVDFDFNFLNTAQGIDENQKGNIKINENKFRLDLNQQLKALNTTVLSVVGEVIYILNQLKHN